MKSASGSWSEITKGKWTDIAAETEVAVCAFTGEAQGCGLAEEFFTGFELAALPWGHDERCRCKCAFECGGEGTT